MRLRPAPCVAFHSASHISLYCVASRSTRLRLAHTQALYVLVNGRVLANMSAALSEIYSVERDADGFLYVISSSFLLLDTRCVPLLISVAHSFVTTFTSFRTSSHRLLTCDQFHVSPSLVKIFSDLHSSCLLFMDLHHLIRSSTVPLQYVTIFSI